MEPILGLTKKILTEKEFIEKFVDDMLVVSESVQKPSNSVMADKLNYYFGIVPGGASYDPNHCLVYYDSNVNASVWNTDFDSIDMQQFWRNMLNESIHVDVSLPDPSAFPQNKHFDYNTFVDGKLIHEGQLTVNGTVINVAEVLNENVVPLGLNNNTNLVVSATLDIYACLKLDRRGDGIMVAPRKVASAFVLGNTATIQYDGSAIYYIDTNKYSTDDFFWRFSLLINCVQPIYDACLVLNGVSYTMNLNSQGDLATSFAIDVNEPISFITGLDNIDIDFTLGPLELKTLELSGCTLTGVDSSYSQRDIPISNNLVYRSARNAFIEFYTPTDWANIEILPKPLIVTGDILTNADEEPGTAIKIVFDKSELRNLVPNGAYLMRVQVPITINYMDKSICMVFQVEVLNDGEISLRDRECFIELGNNVPLQNMTNKNVKVNHSNILNGIVNTTGVDLGKGVSLYLNNLPRLLNYVHLTFGKTATLYTGNSFVNQFYRGGLNFYSGSLLHTSYTPTIFDVANAVINNQLRYKLS